MKKIFFSALIILTAFSSGSILIASCGGEGNEPLPIGAKAPLSDRSMIATDGSKTSIEEAKGENGLLLIFSCNTCPFVIYWEDRYPELYEMCKENNIGMVLVNSNEAKRDGDDSMEEMKKHAMEAGYEFPYVIDEDSELANSVGAKTTPHVYLFNSSLNLEYSGAIDDNYREKDGVENPYLFNAIGKMLKGEKIDPNTTKPVGCSIKRVKI